MITVMERALVVLALAVSGAACGGPGPPVEPPDAARPEDAAGARGVLRLGEGEREFRPIEDGDVLLLARGCQGSQHVWMTLRSERMDPRGMVVELSMRRLDDGALVSAMFRLRLSFTPDPSGDYAQLTGLTLQVPMPDDAIGRDLVLRGRIEDRAGVEASDERRVRVAWGPEVCTGETR
jgi:predicted small lipoprotein YifL